MLQLADAGFKRQSYIEAIDLFFCFLASGGIKGQELFEDQLVAMGIEGHLDRFLLVVKKCRQVADRSIHSKIGIADLKRHGIELYQAILHGSMQVEIFDDIGVVGDPEGEVLYGQLTLNTLG